MSAQQRNSAYNPKVAQKIRARAAVVASEAREAALLHEGRKLEIAIAVERAQIETCYQQHTPRQIFHAKEMQASGFNLFDMRFTKGEVCWQGDDVVVTDA